MGRNREGFSQIESKEISNTFERFADPETGEVDVRQAGGALRWLGYPSNYEALQHAISKVDVDCSGQLNEPEMKKLVRIYHAQEVDFVREVFESHDIKGIGILNPVQAREAFACIDACANEEQFLTLRVREIEAAGGNGLNLAAFIGAVEVLRTLARKSSRDNYGFSQEEVMQYRAMFQRYDADHSGEIEKMETVRLLEEQMHDLAHDESL